MPRAGGHIGEKRSHATHDCRPGALSEILFHLEKLQEENNDSLGEKREREEEIFLIILQGALHWNNFC